VVQTLWSRLTAILIAGVVMTSCAKKENLEVDNETQSVVDYAIADQEFMAMVPFLFQHLSNTSSSGAEKGFSPGCAGLNFEKGDTNNLKNGATYYLGAHQIECSAKDGKTRTGKISLRLNDKFQSEGSQTVIKLVNYFADEVGYECDSMIVLNAGSTASYRAFRIQIVKGRCTTFGKTIHYTCDRTLAIYPAANASESGAFTTIYGEASGVNRMGLPFKVEIRNDITKHNGCAFFDKGEIEITPEGYKTRLVDFGKGACDDQAFFTVSENTVAFKLK
jgi:hypothetical protein